MATIEITDNSSLFLEELERKVPIILEEWGLAGEGFAKKHITQVVYDTPPSPNYQRTGNLRNSLTHTYRDHTAYIGTNVDYGKFVELGTSKMPPRPFVEPAASNHTDEYKKIMEYHLTT